MILVFRILADVLWNMKAFNIGVNIMLLIMILSQFVRGNVALHKSAHKPLMIVLFLFLLFSLSFYNNVNEVSMILYFKVSFSFLMFFYGTIYKGNIMGNIKALEKLSILFILFNFTLSFFSFSYQYWGQIRTFNGLYYFKTDMALATVVFLSFVLVSDSLSKAVKILLALLSLYLIYLTNARIHLLSFFLVLTINSFSAEIFYKLKRKIAIYVPIGLLFFAGVIELYNIFNVGLKIELFSSEAYSDKNLQGRNQIWEALLYGFNKSSISSQLFGISMLEDVNIINKYTDGLEHNAHNGYLYLLVAVGAVGTLTFFYFTYLIFSQLFRHVEEFSRLKKKLRYYSSYPLLNLALSHSLIFFVASFTASSILFQQQTWFFMFFVGYLFNDKFIRKVKAEVLLSKVLFIQDSKKGANIK